MVNYQEIVQSYEKEKAEAEVARADVIQLLSHDESPTRRRLVEVLRRQADVIQAGADIDRDMVLLSGDPVTESSRQ